MTRRILHLISRTAPVAALVALLALGGSFGGQPAALAQQQPFDPSRFTVGFELVAEGLDSPLQVVDPGDGSGRLFVVEKGGRIRIVVDGAIQDEPFLDISDQVSDGSEQGLLSMAFHPRFAENGTFFIDYTDVDGNTQIERWRVSADDPNRADPGSVETILSVEQPFANHNGGLLLFGPDGYMYVGLGDGGSQGDPNGNGQDVGTLLATILRIDVDPTSGDLAYGIPQDNPLVGQDGARPEIWLYGLRNPWRFSFDRETNDLYIADVGGTAYEEIDIFPAGGEGRNFGWSIMEGPECYQSGDCDPSGLQLPVFSYTHEFGCSVTGGYIYRGTQYPELQGVYLFSDYCSGLIWGLGQDGNGAWIASEPIGTGMSVSSFGEDANGELYIVDLRGAVYRVTSGS